MADQDKSKTGRGLRIALVLSLAVNMAVVGIVAGFALRTRDQGPPQRFDLALGPIGAALPREDRREIARALRDRTDLRLPRRGEASPLIAELVAALRADPFDPAALETATKAPAERILAVQGAAAELLTQRVIAMTPAQRAAFADRIEAGLRKRHN